MRVFKGKIDNSRVSRTEALACTPVKNTQVRELRLESGEVLLTYQMRIRPWAVSLIGRLGGSANTTPTKKLQLDALGTTVWDMMDGERSVQQVIRKFANKHRLHPQEAEVAVTRFLRELGKRGLIGLK